MSTLTDTLTSRWKLVREGTDESLVNTEAFLYSALLLARELEEHTDSAE